MPTSSERCVFCEIVAGRIDGHVVWSDDSTTVFLDRAPLFRGHLLVVPNAHVVTLGDLAPATLEPLFSTVRRMSMLVVDALGADGSFVANNNVVSQSVAHLHVHVVGKWWGGGPRGFFLPRTKYAPGEAEATASKLRAALG
jgi:histidine triad (HIT) family protein